jgi:hypothetical protein
MTETAGQHSPITAEDCAQLTALAHQLRAMAEPQGPLHAWWDWIGDIEAVVAGEPTLLHLTPAEYMAEAHRLLRTSRERHVDG